MRVSSKGSNMKKQPRTPDDYVAMIGKRVTKLSLRPFKSTHKINTVTGIATNPHTNKMAFTFAEDDSVVDCRNCIEAK